MQHCVSCPCVTLSSGSTQESSFQCLLHVSYYNIISFIARIVYLMWLLREGDEYLPKNVKLSPIIITWISLTFLRFPKPLNFTPPVILALLISFAISSALLAQIVSSRQWEVVWATAVTGVWTTLGWVWQPGSHVQSEFPQIKPRWWNYCTCADEEDCQHQGKMINKMQCELNYAECERKERKQSYSGKKDNRIKSQILR